MVLSSPQSIRLRVLFLGPARDLSGVSESVLEVPDASPLSAAIETLTERFPRLKEHMSRIRLAVNQEYAAPDKVLRNGDELALIPPVSGGSDESGAIIELVTEPIEKDRLRAFIYGDPTLGGITTFEGVTRSEIDPVHERLIRLDYEAYESMAVQQMEQMAREAKRRWSAGRVAVVHRLGPVPPAEVSVMIAVACPHRGESFAACRWLIDTLKKDVPIWKKDVFEDGFVRWVEPSALKIEDRRFD